MESLKDINWNQLYYFYEVAKAQSLKLTSKKLSVSPANLSEQIKKVEATFGLHLFSRNGRAITLTREGIVLFEHVSEIFESGSKLLERYSTDVIGGYPVNVGLEDAISHEVATEFASQYWDLYAQFGTVNTVRQTEHGVLIENILNSNIDWGLSLKQPKLKSLSSAKVGEYELVFSCSKELYEKFRDPIEIIKNIPFGEINWDKTMYKIIKRYLRDQGITPKEHIQSDHIDFLRRLCERGRCVMFMPQNPYNDYWGLKTFKLDVPLIVSLYAIWRKDEEKLIAIRTLKKLLDSQGSILPQVYEDANLQIQASDVDEDLLKK